MNLLGFDHLFRKTSTKQIPQATMNRNYSSKALNSNSNSAKPTVQVSETKAVVLKLTNNTLHKCKPSLEIKQPQPYRSQSQLENLTSPLQKNIEEQKYFVQNFLSAEKEKHLHIQNIVQSDLSNQDTQITKRLEQRKQMLRGLRSDPTSPVRNAVTQKIETSFEESQLSQSIISQDASEEKQEKICKVVTYYNQKINKHRLGKLDESTIKKIEDLERRKFSKILKLNGI